MSAAASPARAAVIHIAAPGPHDLIRAPITVVAGPGADEAARAGAIARARRRRASAT